jgi:hypothetical protein
MRLPLRFALIAATASMAMALPVSAALAADARGCSGTVVSLDSAEDELGRAEAPGAGGTSSDPLPVDTAGTVAWKGSTDATITDATWSVSAMGVSFLSGTFANAEGLTSSEGVQNLAELPDQIAWLLTGDMVVPVSGSISGTGGSCSASGYVTGTGSPTSSPIFYAGAGAAVLGVAMAAGVFAGTKAVAVTAASAAGGGGAA